jgi:hypothetical protein
MACRLNHGREGLRCGLRPVDKAGPNKIRPGAVKFRVVREGERGGASQLPEVEAQALSQSSTPVVRFACPGGWVRFYKTSSTTSRRPASRSSLNHLLQRRWKEYRDRGQRRTPAPTARAETGGNRGTKNYDGKFDGPVGAQRLAKSKNMVSIRNSWLGTFGVRGGVTLASMQNATAYLL